MFFCDHFSFDKNNKPNLLGIFKNINLVNIPSKYLKFVVVVFLDNLNTLPGKERILKEKHLSPKGADVIPKMPHMVLPVEVDKSEGIITLELGNVEFKEHGQHLFQLTWNSKIIGEAILVVNKVSN
jgi:hypothetical protein